MRGRVVMSSTVMAGIGAAPPADFKIVDESTIPPAEPIRGSAHRTAMSLRGGSGRVVALVTTGVAAVAALVAVLVVQPWSGGGNAGPRTVPDRAGAPDCGVFVQEVASGG